jgi:hypothetical protein
MGLETRPPPDGFHATAAIEAEPVEGSAASSSPDPKAPGPPRSAPDLPPIAAKAEDLAAIKKAVDDAASVGGRLWLSYVSVLLYLAVAAGAVTHADLFFEKPVKLPFLGIELPLFAFLAVAPILFVIVHAYTLVHLVFLTDKAKRYHHALYDQIGGRDGLSQAEVDARKGTRDGLRRQLPSNIFVQFLAGPSDMREGGLGWLLRAIAWITLAVAPVLLLLFLQIQFLPYHSAPVTWTQRVALGLDLALIWWLWRKILSGREMDGGRRRVTWLWAPFGFALSLAVLLFSVVVVTFPGEWQEDHLPGWQVLPAMDEWGNPAAEVDSMREPRKAFRDWVVNARKVSLHDWLFNGVPDETTRRRFPFSNTLVLPALNVYEGLGIDDPEKANWHAYVFHARGRDLRGAIFAQASLPKVDFHGAQLEGAFLIVAQLQGASLRGAQLQGASLDGAQLQGASLREAQLQGASLAGAELRGAALDSAQLQGARLIGARLQGASLDGAQLQGASFEGAHLEATDLSEAYLWRTNRPKSPSTVAAIRMSGESWLPEWSDKDGKPQPWDNRMFQALRKRMESLPTDLPHDEALKRIQSLDCGSSDTALASCNPTATPSPEAATWRKALEAARVSDEIYAAARAKALKDLVCSSGDDGIYVVHGFGFAGRLDDAGDAASRLASDLANKENKDCPGAASLTDGDRAKLLQIKQQMKEAGK